MKNIINQVVFFLVIFLLMPQIVSAIWWNPFSWFSDNKNKPITSQRVTIESFKEISLEQKIKEYPHEENLKGQVKETKESPVVKITNPQEKIIKSGNIVNTKQKIGTSSVLVLDNNEEKCTELKEEYDIFYTHWELVNPFKKGSHIEVLSTNLINRFGLDRMDSGRSDLDLEYHKYFDEKPKFYSKIEDSKLAILELPLISFSELEVENIKNKLNKSLDLYKESFDYTLFGYSSMSSDKYAFVMGSKIMPAQNIDDAKSNIMFGIEKSKSAALYSLSATTDYEKIKKKYNDSLIKLNCK